VTGCDEGMGPRDVLLRYENENEMRTGMGWA
jgi:hypothetical protein